MEVKKWLCDFEPQPELGRIVCHRRRAHPLAAGGPEIQLNYTSYTKHGIKPAEWALDPQSRESWRSAVAVMGWEPLI